MGKCRTSGGVIPYNESNVKKKQKKSLVSVVSENRKEMLEGALNYSL